MIVPYIFFVALKEKYKSKNINNLFIICLSIFFIPAFRYSSVWANDRITTDIFILLGCYFFYNTNPLMHFRILKIKRILLDNNIIMLLRFMTVLTVRLLASKVQTL